MSVPHSYESSIRVHRAAFYNWLGGLRVDYPADPSALWTQRANWPILRVFASPDRIFAAVSDLLVSDGWFKDQSSRDAMLRAAKDVSILPLPLATIVMGDPVVDTELASAVKRPIRTYNTDTNQWERHPWPGHYRTQFTVSFWCRKAYTDDYIREWLYPQFGNIGAGNSETYIPVKHAEPWGTMIQALRFDGSDDQSVLEGQDPRYKRFNFIFTLRTWIMKLTVAEASRAETVVMGSAGYVVVPTDADPIPVDAPGVTPYETGNLFTIPMPLYKVDTLWPKTGDATVRPAIDPRSQLSIVVTESDDTVDLGEWLTEPDITQSIFSVWFDYASTGPVSLIAGSRQPVDDVRVETTLLTLPKKLKMGAVHRFALFDKRLASLSFAGTGFAASITVRNVHVSRVTLASPISPTTTTSTQATWDGLVYAPYLLCVKITSAGSGDLITVHDDAVSSGYTESRRADYYIGSGIVFLIQPSGVSLRISWPMTTTVAIVWVQRYYSTYHGNDAA